MLFWFLLVKIVSGDETYRDRRKPRNMTVREIILALQEAVKYEQMNSRQSPGSNFKDQCCSHRT